MVVVEVWVRVWFIVVVEVWVTVDHGLVEVWVTVVVSYVVLVVLGGGGLASSMVYGWL